MHIFFILGTFCTVNIKTDIFYVFFNIYFYISLIINFCFIFTILNFYFFSLAIFIVTFMHQDDKDFFVNKPVSETISRVQLQPVVILVKVYLNRNTDFLQCSLS